MSSSLDGLVIVWDIETFTATFTMKCTQPLFGLKFYQEDRFLCRHGDRVSEVADMEADRYRHTR
jgi:hypothetical protein